MLTRDPTRNGSRYGKGHRKSGDLADTAAEASLGSDGKIEALLWKRLVFQREMPPFARIVFETTGAHLFDKPLAVGRRFLGKRTVRRFAHRVETVETSAEIERVGI